MTGASQSSRSTLPTNSAGTGKPPELLKVAVFLLPTTAALGSYLPGVGPLFGHRLLILLVAALALFVPPSTRSQSLRRLVLAVAFTWAAWGLLLTFGAFDTTAAFRSMVGISLGLTLAVSALRIQAAFPRFILWLSQGWILSFLITGAIAAWEIGTGQHLEHYLVDAQGLSSTMPAATFYNPNAYAIYLVAVQAVLIWSLTLAKRPRARLFLTTLITLCIALTATTGSRLSLVAVALLITAYIASGRFGIRRAIAIPALLGVLFWQLIPGAAGLVNEYLPEDIRNTSISQAIDDLAIGDSSAGRRVELYKAAAWLTLDTTGAGVGPGNFGAALVHRQPPFQTGDTLAPHSFIGEVSAEYGLPVLMGVGILCWSVFRRVAGRKNPERSAILATGLAFIPAGFANSSYLVSSSMWTMFATVLCWAAIAESEDS